MIEKKIICVNDFHKLASSFPNSHPIFRGVSNSVYELIPRFGRSIIANRELRKINKKYTYVVNVGLEENILNRFIREGIPYLSHQPTSQWEWISLAQHHGLPTRMLDWTNNPLVAAYFACCYNSSDTDAAIYVIDDKHNFNEKSSEVSPFNIDETVVFHPQHINPRITAQSGLFTVHPKPDETFVCTGLQKWTIGKSLKIEFEIMTKQYGIQYSSLFPGLDGIAQSLISDYGLNL